MTDKDVELQISGDESGLVASLNRAETAIKGATRSMQDSFGGVAGSVQSLGTMMTTALQTAGVMLLVEGFNKLKAVIEETTSRAIEIRNMSEILEVTATQFQAMQVAADEAGVSSQQLFRATDRLVQLLHDARNGSAAAADKLMALGFTHKQLADSTFGTAQMLAALSGRLNDSSTATETMSELVKEFGPRIALAAEALKNLSANTDDWIAKAQTVGALDDRQISRLKEMRASWDELGAKIDNAEAKLLLFGQTAANALKYVSPVVAAFNLIGSALGGSKKEGGGAAAGESPRVQQSDAEAAALVANEQRISKAQLDAVKTAVSEYKEGTAERLAMAQAYATLARQYYGSAEFDTVKEADAKVIEETRRFNDEQARLKDSAHKKELEAETKHAEAVKQLYHATLQAFRQSVTQFDQLVDEEVKKEESAIATRERIAKEEVGLQEDLLQQEVQAGTAGFATQLRLALEFEERRYQIASQALRERLKLAQLESVEHKRLLDDLAVLDAQHARKRAALDAQAAQAGRAPAIAMIKTLEAQWQQGLSAMLQGQLKFSDAVRGAWQSIAAAMADSIARSVLENAKGMAIQALTGKKAVLNDAYQAGAGAFAATARIPYVGPFLAPAAAAAAFAATAAFGGNISAAGGYDIPRGINPMTQLHEREMVLPAKHADVIRGLADGGGSGGSSPSFAIHLNAIDARSGADFLRKNSGQIVQQLHREWNRFNRPYPVR